MIIKNFLFQSIFLFFLFISNVHSDGLFSSSKNTFLNVDEAFKISLKKNEKKSLSIKFDIANGYYLYKDKIKISVDNEEITKIFFPKSKIKEDEFFGKSEIYDKNFSLIVEKNNKRGALLEVLYQGCANKGLCYPPIKKTFFLGNDVRGEYIKTQKISESEYIYDKLLSNNYLTNIILFLGFGLLLSFTPCVLPMVPILSGLIIKSNNVSSRKPFLLSMYYVLGLCLLYLLVGLFIGYSTNIYNIQSAFQEPLYLVIFSFILILLSFSMFGFYEIKISNSFQKFITDISNKINIGGYRGSFIMGFLSALIVGPCVAPPLAGIFIYITSENPGSLWTGILFLSLAIGMSIPLLAYGTFIGRIIPKTGQWMRYINYFIGILLLITAIFFIDRLIPILNVNKQDPELVFNKISNVKEFNNILSSTKEKMTFLDVYADWCIECKLMERKTFLDPTAKEILKDFLLVKIDVTNNSKDDIELLKYLNVMGPPAYKFFDRDGTELKGFSIQGYMDAKKFIEHLNQIKDID